MDPESAASQLQRKVELQSPEDLSYLIENVRSAAAARINEAFPHVDGQDGDNDLRNQIEDLVNDYISQTFTLASPNLSINGLPVASDAILRDSSDPDKNVVYEPFNSRKRQRVADLVSQEEKLLEEVASLKRAVPRRAASEHAQRLRDGLSRDEALHRGRVVAVASPASAPNAAAAKLDGVGPLERQRGVEDGFRGAVEALGRLKKDMPAVVAKMERARVAGEYVVTDGR